MAQKHAARQTEEAAAPPGLWIPLGVAFVAGWVVMMLELLGARLLAPYFGYSIYQWGALIGVVLSFLACGYTLGGQVGDRPWARTFLFWALTVSAAWVLLVPLLAPGLLPGLRQSGPAWGAVLASAALLGLPSVLLGSVSPIVIRLTFQRGVASAAGRVYAVSTLGSIGGTFFTAFYAIPRLGTEQSHYGAGVLLLLAVAGLALVARRPRHLAVLALLLVPGLSAGGKLPPSVIHHEESVHNIIRVTDDGSTRGLYLNYGFGAQTLLRKDQLLTGEYYDGFLLGPLINQARTVLFLGAAGGTSLKQLLAVYPQIKVVGVELDPAVLTVAERYFGLKESPRLELVTEDARWYLEATDARFDLIAIDLFVTGQIPFFTTTREFFSQVADRLTQRGVVMMHVRSVGSSDELLGPFARTLGAVFPSVFVFGRGNLILLASRAPLTRPELVRALQKGAHRSPELGEVASRSLPTLRVADADGQWPIFTDDRNDVELRTFQMSLEGR